MREVNRVDRYRPAFSELQNDTPKGLFAALLLESRMGLLSF